MGSVWRSLVACSSGGLPLRTRFAVAKWFYCVMFTATAVAVWVLRDYAGTFLADNVSSFAACRTAGTGAAALDGSPLAPPPPPGAPGTSPGRYADPEAVRQCAGKEVALRVSLANLCVFAAHLLACLWLRRPEDPRVHLHAGLWVWQFLLWVGALIGFMWIPSSALVGYAHFSRYASGIFLVLQLVLLVNAAYEVNEWLVERDSCGAWAVLLTGTGVCVGAGLALTGVAYHYYAPRASCSLNIFFVTWNLIMGIVLIGLLFVPGRAPTAGLLTSSGVWLYCTYLIYSALASLPRGDSCVRGAGVGAGGWVGVVAFFLALAAVVYATITAGVASRDMFGGGSDGGPDGDLEVPYRPDFYHLVFATASCYIAMLFTNWSTSTSGSAFELDTGWASTWVKVASSWACALLYGWTVVAPALLRDRDFGPPV